MLLAAHHLFGYPGGIPPNREAAPGAFS